MIVFEKWKIALISMIVLASAVLASPNIIGNADDGPGPFGLSRINLGLDLQGGSYLLLKVELEDVIEERLSNSVEAIRSEMRGERIGLRNLTSDANSLSFDLRQQDDRPKAREILGQILGQDLTITATDLGFSAAYSETGLQEIGRMTIEQAIEIVRSRIDETGTKEPIIQRQGQDRILIQLPGLITLKMLNVFWVKLHGWASRWWISPPQPLKPKHQAGFRQDLKYWNRPMGLTNSIWCAKGF